ncbi:MAG: alpha/beta fold hydrolase [Actinomycetaceae bacterium]|nr:alpha/beta fold hydrolase [Actinomycetaceae bacterium]
MSTTPNTLAVDITGPEDGPVVVLGSALGADRHMWDEVMPQLANYRVVRYDHPGHGLSRPLQLTEAEEITCPHTGEAGHTPHASASAHAGALRAALDEAGIEKFHIAGLSLGGMMALWWGINRPQDVLSVTMLSSGPVITPSDPWWEKAAHTRREGTGQIVEATLQRWFTPKYLEANGEQVRRTRRTYLECDGAGFAQCCEVIATLDCRPGLGQLQVPVGIVSAQYDASLPFAQADELAQTIAERSGVKTIVHRVEDAAHLSAVEQPQVVGSALVELLGEFSA